MTTISARFDHAVIVVRSLSHAVRSFERLGFNVVKGGRTGPVHNALVLFSDRTYLELTTNRFSALRPVFRVLHATGLIPGVAAKRNDMLRRFLPWGGPEVPPVKRRPEIDPGHGRSSAHFLLLGLVAFFPVGFLVDEGGAVSWLLPVFVR